MAEYAFTFGARLCLIKTYVQVEIGGAQGYIAFPFVVEHDRQSLRPIGNREGQTLSFFAQTEQGPRARRFRAQTLGAIAHDEVFRSEQIGFLLRLTICVHDRTDSSSRRMLA